VSTHEYYIKNREKWRTVYYKRIKAKLATQPEYLARKRESNKLYMRRTYALRSERRHENRRMCIELLGGKCKMCGWTGHPTGFEFDHVIPSTKTYKIALLMPCKDLTKLLAEIAKCQLLCGTCHNIKTALNEEWK
jgi:5-methylcytosine-specific restriction endonuclease McrA